MQGSRSAAIRIGCSSWIYPHWRGRFYPGKRAVKNWFTFDAEHFGSGGRSNNPS